MKLLMHICCGPCATYPAKSLRDGGHEVHAYFYNPNIHPLAEFRLRLESAKKALGIMDVPADMFVPTAALVCRDMLAQLQQTTPSQRDFMNEIVEANLKLAIGYRDLTQASGDGDSL